MDLSTALIHYYGACVAFPASSPLSARKYLNPRFPHACPRDSWFIGFKGLWLIYDVEKAAPYVLTLYLVMFASSRRGACSPTRTSTGYQS